MSVHILLPRTPGPALRHREASVRSTQTNIAEAARQERERQERERSAAQQAATTSAASSSMAQLTDEQRDEINEAVRLFPTPLKAP